MKQDEAGSKRLLLRCVRRRLAASFDSGTIIPGMTLQGWEQYIYPPLGDNLLMGDILFEKKGNKNDPKSYRLVLTPSCDMQANTRGKRKVDVALVSKCSDSSLYIDALIDNNHIKREDISERLARFLHEPQVGGYIPMPKFEKLLPPMVADLRDLELIPISDITLNEEEDKKYLRTLSTDSPFRENIAWANIQIFGRPGLPDRDVEKWAKDMLTSVEDPTKPVREVAK